MESQPCRKVRDNDRTRRFVDTDSRFLLAAPSGIKSGMGLDVVW